MTTTMHRPDHELKTAIIEELRWAPSVDSDHIGVSVNDGAVTLSGEVRTFPERRQAEQAALRVRGVTAIAEEMTVRPASWGSVNDSDVARDVADALNRAIDVPADKVKATVHEHVITLSGHVPWHFQREAAVRSIAYLTGVKDVVNLIAIRPTVSPDGVKGAIVAALARSARLEASHTEVTADADGVVTLNGKVTDMTDRRLAASAAWGAPGVTRVVNNLRIQI